MVESLRNVFFYKVLYTDKIYDNASCQALALFLTKFYMLRIKVVLVDSTCPLA